MMEDVKFYQSYADILVVIHALWSALVFGGMIIMFFYPSYALAEIIIVSITLLSSLPFGGTCPLTLLELKLRARTDPTYSNEGGFIVTYVNKIFGAHISPLQGKVVIGTLYVFAYAAATLLLIYR
jgi:hypothetical protein